MRQIQFDGADEGLVDSLLPVVAGNMATRVVQQAASVLEQELAAGIRAARRVEERYIDVAEIRGRSSDHVMQRFRADAHEVVDILFDVFTVATDSASNLVERAFVIGGGAVRRRVGQQGGQQGSVAAPVSSRPEPAPEPSLPVLTPPVPIFPGQTMEISIAVENPSDVSTRPVTFGCADLVSADGDVIDAEQVVFLPDSLVLLPRSTETVAIRIHIPRDKPAGSYRGMFWADNLPAVRAMLVIPVAEG